MYPTKQQQQTIKYCMKVAINIAASFTSSATAIPKAAHRPHVSASQLAFPAHIHVAHTRGGRLIPSVITPTSRHGPGSTRAAQGGHRPPLSSSGHQHKRSCCSSCPTSHVERLSDHTHSPVQIFLCRKQLLGNYCSLD